MGQGAAGDQVPPRTTVGQRCQGVDRLAGNGRVHVDAAAVEAAEGAGRHRVVGQWHGGEGAAGCLGGERQLDEPGSLAAARPGNASPTMPGLLGVPPERRVEAEWLGRADHVGG
ncbi:hypothetical protein [Actinomadura madurae]|uniref:hypothetical protein n=1 Tax=Actinomadura madurae TaxID=1993 RepID=UPI0020D24D37|nr:hypothetical protein [Actinomadura madurae]MCQ0010971.1 hypothetical protein [Actinomadura madurae]